MRSFLADLRYAFRQMRHIPAFAAVVVALIGIGIAANATIFTLVDTLLLRKLPVRNPEQLVRIIERRPPIPDSSYFQYDYWRFLRRHSTSFSDVIGQADSEMPMTVAGATDHSRSDWSLRIISRCWVCIRPLADCQAPPAPRF